MNMYLHIAVPPFLTPSSCVEAILRIPQEGLDVNKSNGML